MELGSCVAFSCFLAFGQPVSSFRESVFLGRESDYLRHGRNPFALVIMLRNLHQRMAVAERTITLRRTHACTHPRKEEPSRDMGNMTQDHICDPEEGRGAKRKKRRNKQTKRQILIKQRKNQIENKNLLLSLVEMNPFCAGFR